MSGAVAKPSARYVCPPECGRPPMGDPVTINPRFTAPDGTFSVAYPAVGSAYKVTLGEAGITADLLVGDRGPCGCSVSLPPGAPPSRSPAS